MNFDTAHIIDIVRVSIGENKDVITLKIKMFIERLLKDVDKKIEESAKKLNSPIFSIPGIRFYTGMCILSEIGDIHYFESYRKIIGLAGMNSSKYQSGQYNVPTTALSKRGSHYLRKTLYLCILPVCIFNSTFNKYYNLNRIQGKSHRYVQGHAIIKLLRVIYKPLSENKEFDAEFLK